METEIILRGGKVTVKAEISTRKELAKLSASVESLLEADMEGNGCGITFSQGEVAVAEGFTIQSTRSS